MVSSVPVTKIEPDGFSKISSKNVIICDNIHTISYDAFWSCPNISSVICSKDLKTIKGKAFADCANLYEVTNLAEIIDETAFLNTPINKS